MINYKRAMMFYSPALRYFVAVAEHESVRSAARQLNVASSAVNRHLLNLEREFGIQLFERVGRRLRLSEAGHILQRHAIRALADFDDAVACIDDLSDLRRGQVRIASVESIADSLLPEIVSEFQQDYPGISIDVQVGSAAAVAEGLLASECHLALTFSKADASLGEELFGVELPLCAAVGANHPLASNKSVTIEDCVKFPLVLPKNSLSFGDHILSLLERSEKAGHPASERQVRTNSLRFMRSLVGDHQTIAFQTQLGLHSWEAKPGIKLLPVEDMDLKPDKLSLVCVNKAQLPKAPLEFATYAEKTFGEFTKTHPMISN